MYLRLKVVFEAILMAEVVALAEGDTSFVGEVLEAVFALLAQTFGPLLRLVDNEIALEELL